MSVIRINEDSLHRIISESVIRVLNEADDMESDYNVMKSTVDGLKKDYYIKNIAIDALKKAGYDSIFGDNGHLYFKVGISSYDDIGRIREISLPTFTHSNLF